MRMGSQSWVDLGRTTSSLKLGYANSLLCLGTVRKIHQTHGCTLSLSGAETSSPFTKYSQPLNQLPPENMGLLQEGF